MPMGIEDLDRLELSPYDKNRICSIEASHLDKELQELRIGQSAVDFYNDDIARLYEYVRTSVTSTEDENKVPADGHVYVGELESLKDKDLNAIISDFFNN